MRPPTLMGPIGPEVQLEASAQRAGIRRFIARQKASRLGKWLFGVLVLSGVVVVVVNAGEIGRFTALLRQTRPIWLLAAVVLQLGTYLSIAAAWYVILREAGCGTSFLALVPLSVAKLFSDQAMPSGGLSGVAFFITALRHRGVSRPQCMATLLVSVVTSYVAYIPIALTAALLLCSYHRIPAWLLTVTATFLLVVMAMLAAIFWLRYWGRLHTPSLLRRIPILRRSLRALAAAPGDLLRNPVVLMSATLLQAAIILLDAATLWVMLEAVGQPVSFFAAFPAFVLALMTATIAPIPIGLGAFEGTCVALLRMFGVSLEAALTSTLLLRGFSTWLPMLPGMWLARRALSAETWQWRSWGSESQRGNR